MSQILNKVVKKQEKAVSIFTKLVIDLRSTNEEIDKHMKHIENEELRLNKEKNASLELMKKNYKIINNIEGLFLEKQEV